MISRSALLSVFIFSLPYSAFGFSDADTLNLPQEVMHRDGVWVSRPKPTEKRLRDVMIVNRIDSVEAYVAWIRRNFCYQRDTGPDAWYDADEMLSRRTGDCEDFAFLHQAFLRLMGFSPKVLAVAQGHGNAHAICVFKKTGRYAWFDNGTLLETRAISFEECSKRISERYHSPVLAELDREKAGRLRA